MKDSDNESDEENPLEGETEAGETEEKLETVKPPKKKRKTKKKTDLNKENHHPVKDKLVSFYGIFLSYSLVITVLSLPPTNHPFL